MSLIISMKKLQNGPCSRIKFSLDLIRSAISRSFEPTTHEVDIEGFVMIRFKFSVSVQQAPTIIITTRMSMMTLLPTRDYQVSVEITGKNFSLQRDCPQYFTEWVNANSHPLQNNSELEFDVLAHKTEMIKSANAYANVPTDFNLITDGGSVPIHKACLEAHSDFFKTMFNGNWQETERNGVELQGVTMTTLKRLHTYLYSGTLPDDDLDALYLVARCYLIESLKQKCLIKMAHGANSENLDDLIDFACANNVPEMMKLLLAHHTRDGLVYGSEEHVSSQKVVLDVSGYLSVYGTQLFFDFYAMPFDM